MTKLATLFIISLLLCTKISYSARPDPNFPHTTPLLKTQNKVAKADDVVDESCQGLEDEECLTRRTLAAHLDYIYTQKQKP